MWSFGALPQTGQRGTLCSVHQRSSLGSASSLSEKYLRDGNAVRAGAPAFSAGGGFGVVGDGFESARNLAKTLARRTDLIGVATVLSKAPSFIGDSPFIVHDGSDRSKVYWAASALNIARLIACSKGSSS